MTTITPIITASATGKPMRSEWAEMFVKEYDAKTAAVTKSSVLSDPEVVQQCLGCTAQEALAHVYAVDTFLTIKAMSHNLNVLYGMLQQILEHQDGEGWKG